MAAIAVHILILWAVIALALIGARLHRRLRTEPKSGEFGASLGFIATAFGILMGLLVVSATTHYTTARTEAQAEATAIVSMLDDLATVDARYAAPAAHVVVCYTRSVIDDDWRQMERGRTTQATRTRQTGDEMRNELRSLAHDAGEEGPAVSAATVKMSEAGAARQQLLFLARPAIPIVLWVLIYLGAGVLVFLIASDLVARKETAIAGLASVVLMLTVVIGVLVAMDHPFGPGARIEPTAMRNALSLVEAGQQRDAAFARCN